MKHLLFIFFIVASVSNICAVEYLYPIDTFKHNNKDIVLLMYQSNSNEMQLLAWNAQNDSYKKLLSSQYNPVDVKLLPNHSGVSFIDNGLLKIKKFNKRSVHIVEFDRPIYDIYMVNWLDNQTCYFHAKLGKYYSIYQSDIDGRTIPLVMTESYDNMYPQKIEDVLFYIERNEEKNYKIISVDYLSKSHDGQETVKTVVNDFGKTAIAYLNMINQHEGFVIAYPTQVEENNSLINFQVHYIKIFNGLSYCEHIFDFDLPAQLFFDDNFLLHEAIFPFLPRIAKDRVNFNSAQKYMFIDSLYYDLTDRTILPCSCERFFGWSSKKNVLAYFAPLLIDQQYMYGCMWK